MSIALEFIDFIVPKRIIEDKYPGSWAGCLRDHQALIGETIWYDEHLFRDGAMGSADIESIADQWETRGFQLRDKVDGEEIWRDVCVVDAMSGGSTLPCNWIDIDSDNRTAHLSGAEAGTIIGRDDFEVSIHSDYFVLYDS